MDARGTSTMEELLGDATSKPDKEYLGYKVYSVVDNFYKEIQKNLPDYMEDGYQYRILATGHSLGGAVANLFAAVQTQAGNPNVFCYTFGAIDSIVSSKPVSEGYENIHNIYNDLDTFSPTQFGSIMVYGAGSKYGKFGHMDSYAAEHRTEEQKGQMGLFQIYEHVNHNMDYYLKDLNLVECEYSYGGNDDSDDNYISEEAETQTDAWTVRSELSIPGTPDWYRASPIEGIVMEEKESFLEFVRMYAQVMGAKILYSTDEDPLQLEILEVRSVIALQDPEGKILVLMDLVNRSDQDLSIGLDNIVADGKPNAIELWKSEKVKPSEHLILSIAVNELVESFENAAFPLHVYGADGEELLTTEPIS